MHLLNSDERRCAFGSTALFALYNGYSGVRYGSAWHGSIGIFYFLFMVIGAMSF